MKYLFTVLIRSNFMIDLHFLLYIALSRQQTQARNLTGRSGNSYDKILNYVWKRIWGGDSRSEDLLQVGDMLT